MFVLGQGIPSPRSVRFIISIHQGFLPFPVGDGLFKDTSDGSALTAIIGNPVQAFVVFVINSMVAQDLIQKTIASFLPKHQLGIDLECRRNQPLIWQARTRAQLSCQIPLPCSPNATVASPITMWKISARPNNFVRQRLFWRAPQSQFLSERQLTDARDYLITLITLKTGTRPGALENCRMWLPINAQGPQTWSLRDFGAQSQKTNGWPSNAFPEQFLKRYVRCLRGWDTS